MKKLKEFIKLCHIKVINGGRCPVLSKIEKRYKEGHKIGHTYYRYTEKMSKSVGMKIADAFESLPHEPENRLIKAAYEQLAKEVLDQFNFLVENEDIIFESFQGNGEPYKNSFEMLMDIHNYHLYFFKTERGFGETDYTFKNTMLNKTKIFLNGYELVVNDVFRIVHDVFGHAMNGYSFGPIGEDQAWFTHTKMFTPLAAAALSTETRGQNCWVNFGPHLRNENGELIEKHEEGWLPPNRRPFAEQKMNLLPENLCGIRVYEKDSVVVADYLDFWDPILSIHY